MPSQMVNLQVNASIPIDCDFWSDDEGWKGLCKSLTVTVHGNSFEQVHIETILREHPKRNVLRTA
jgi:hypothetical protein